MFLRLLYLVKLLFIEQTFRTAPYLCVEVILSSVFRVYFSAANISNTSLIGRRRWRTALHLNAGLAKSLAGRRCCIFSVAFLSFSANEYYTDFCEALHWWSYRANDGIIMVHLVGSLPSLPHYLPYGRSFFALHPSAITCS